MPGSVLYVPLYFPGFEGWDHRLIFPLAIASATQAAVHPLHPVRRTWQTILAVSWAVGCTSVCTPQPFFADPATQIIVQNTLIALAAVAFEVGAVKGLLLNRMLPLSTRVLYGAALVVLGVALVAVRAPVISRPHWAAAAFGALVLTGATLILMSAIMDHVGVGRRSTRA